MKMIYEYEYTNNRRVYNRARKHVLENKGEIHCAYCPYHKNENVKRHIWGKPQTWKKHRRTQYKVVEYNVG